MSGEAEGTGVVVITGVMAAGKSTVAQLLAERFPRAAHIRGDVFRRFLVSGRVDPSPEMPPEAWKQLLLRYRLEISTADSYAENGFVAIVQDVIVGPILTQVLSMIRTRPARLIVLDPDPSTIAARERGRHKSGYVERWSPAQLVHAHRSTTPRAGLWIDTSQQGPDETARTILDRFDEAILSDHHLRLVGKMKG